METVLIVIGSAVIVSLLWNVSSNHGLKKMSKKRAPGMDDAKYFELKYKMEFFKAVFSVIVAATAYIGYTSIHDIKKSIREELTQKTDSINKLLEIAEKDVAQLSSSNDSMAQKQKNAVDRLVEIEQGINSQYQFAKSIQGRLEQINSSNMIDLNYYIIDSLRLIVKTKNDVDISKRYYFKDLKTSSGDELPVFKKSPIIIPTVGNRVLPVISEITTEGFNLTCTMAFEDVSEIYIGVLIFHAK